MSHDCTDHIVKEKNGNVNWDGKELRCNYCDKVWINKALVDRGVLIFE